MSKPKTADAIHQHVLILWGRYRDLIRDILVLQGKLSDLERDIQSCGKSIYELYQRTDARLDGEDFHHEEHEGTRSDTNLTNQ